MSALTFPIAVAKKLLQDHHCTPFTGTITDVKHDYYIASDDVTIIRLPKTKLIDWEILEIIALEQLGISRWDFDYWLGENGVN